MNSLTKPGVVTWFKAYCGILTFLYLLTSLASLPFFIIRPEDLEMDRLASLILGAFLLAGGIVLMVASLLPLFLRPRRWVWIYSLVLICLGMTSACFLPMCVPLLIFWFKKETKAYYGYDIPEDASRPRPIPISG